MKKKFIIANWKMELTPKQSLKLIKDFQAKIKLEKDKEMIVCPSFLSLGEIGNKKEKFSFSLGSQNSAFKNKGALTGEISPKNLKNLGCRYVILGHSERRFLGETNDNIKKKVEIVWENNLTPILCIGENLQQRQKKQTKKVLKKQLLECLPENNKKKIIVAYEPIWAIGTGKVVKEQEAKEVFEYLQGLVEKKANINNFSFVYGGSVNPENINIFSSLEKVDGVLVGGSSLKVNSFNKIYNSF